MCFLTRMGDADHWEYNTSDCERRLNSSINFESPVSHFVSFWNAMMAMVHNESSLFVNGSAVVENVTEIPGGWGATARGPKEIVVPEQRVEDLAVYLLEGVLLPTIAALGMVGNCLNVAVLWWRHRRRDIDIMEKGALLGLIALAVSDVAFCAILFPKIFLPTETLFKHWGVHLMYQLYSLYFKNVFIKTSTWLTLVVGFARYVGICHPLRARFCIKLSGIRCAILFTYAFWFIVEAPLLWTYDVKEFDYGNVTYYYIDVGAFERNETMEVCFTYIWAILGYFFPVVVLIFCNGCLIRALKQSQRMRREAAVQNNSSYHDASNRITLTLILLIVMFIVLVSPSELIHFYHDTLPEQEVTGFKLGILLTNVLQAVNFAFSFVLYCLVNATFRRTVRAWVSLRCAQSQGSLDGQELQQNKAQPSASSSSGSGSVHTRTYYCALKQSISIQNGAPQATVRTMTNKWQQTCSL